MRFFIDCFFKVYKSLVKLSDLLFLEKRYSRTVLICDVSLNFVVSFILQSYSLFVFIC